MLDADPQFFTSTFLNLFVCSLLAASRLILMGDTECFQFEVFEKARFIGASKFQSCLTLSEYADREVNYFEGGSGCVNSLRLGHNRLSDSMGHNARLHTKVHLR